MTSPSPDAAGPAGSAANDVPPDWVLRDLPEPNARRVLSPAQGALLLALAAIVAALLCWRARPTLFALNALAIGCYLMFVLYKLALQLLAALAEHAVAIAPGAPLPDDALPRYSILVPLYREERAVPGLLAHLARLDYPPDRIEILLLVEADDDATRAAIAAIALPPQAHVVLVPPAVPRTKPKACNLGVEHATGELLVIFDAEDRPEPDQLRKAACAFAAASAQVVCLQARLNVYNRGRSWLTRLFTAEYSAWFDGFLPGLHLVDAPIPLGGTSNHFRADALRRIGRWDPFNVTEDCDLGLRLYALGLRTACLNSTTWEEAPPRLGTWLRQRSRWVKGYVQTWLVHLRRHGALLRAAGPTRAVHVHLLFGATAACLLMNPLFWALSLLWIAGGARWISGLYPLWLLLPALACFLFGNAAFVLGGMLACLRRGWPGLVPWCLLMPLYWALMSVAAWRGTLQLIRRPSLWEKTPHEGVAPGEVVA